MCRIDAAAEHVCRGKDQPVTFKSVFVTLACVACASAPAFCADRPNIVFIMADDLGLGDIGILNQNARAAQGLPSFATPNIDSIAQNGVRFNHMYAGAPNCSPSRAVLLTGFHEGHTMFDNATLDVDIRPGQQDATWGQVLQQAGYATGMFGKWHLGGVTGNLTSIRTPSALPTQKGFETAYGPMTGHYRLAFHWESDGQGGMRQVAVPGEPTWTGSGAKVVYGDTMVANRAVDFIRSKAQTSQPFAAYIPFMAPHIPLDQVPKNHPYANAMQSDGTPWPQAQRDYAGMMWLLDQQVGQVLQAIDDPNNDGNTADSVANNTLVIFTSDNGALAPGTASGFNPLYFNSNLSEQGYKSMAWEGGMHTPFFARWTGTIAPGSQNNAVASFADIMPTFAELAGQDTPLGIDGTSILSDLTGGPPSAQRDPLFFVQKYQIGAANPGGWTVRVGDWKLIKRRPSDVFPVFTTTTYRLFNVANDPGELVNLSNLRPDIVAALEALGIAEGGDREPLGPAVDSPTLTENKNTYFTQYKTWAPQGGSSDFFSAANWSGGTQREQPATPEANNWNTGPADNWLATMSNAGPTARQVTLAADANVLALELAGPGAEMRLVVPAGRKLTARNGLRISAGGAVTLHNGELNTNRDVDIRAGGKLAAQGTINGQQALFAGIPEFANLRLFEPKVINGGELTIGDGATAGVLTILGDYQQKPSGSLRIDLFASSGGAGTAFDQLAVQRTAKLAGLLDVSVSPGTWQPQLGDMFQILTAAGGLTGTFSTTAMPPLTPGWGWDVLYSPTAVTLKVIELTPQNLTIAAGEPMGNSVTLAAGQTLGLSGFLRIGKGASHGDLTIGAGAAVTVAGMTTIDPGGVLNLTGGSLTTGGVTNTGGAILWQSGAIHVTGPLPVAAAQGLGANVAVGDQQTLEVDGLLAVDGGILTITPGGQVHADGGVEIGAAGLFTLDGGTLATSQLHTAAGGVFNWNAGAIQWGDNLSIAPAGPLGAAVTLAANQSLSVAGVADVAAGGTLKLSGGQLNAATLALNGGTFEAHDLAGVPALEFNAGLIKLTADAALAGNGPLGPNVWLGSGRTLEVVGALAVGAAAHPTTLVISTGGAVTAAGATTIRADSTLVLDGGTLTTAALLGEAGATFGWNTGTLHLTGNLDAAPTGNLGNVVTLGAGQTLQVDGATNVAADGAIHLAGGKLSTAALNIAPGGAFDWQVGQLNFTGNQTVSASGVVGSALGGLSIGVARHLSIAGTATLNSPLAINGGTFSAGQVVHPELLNFSTGTFNLTGSDLLVGSGGLFGATLAVASTATIHVSQATLVAGGAIVTIADGGNLSSQSLVNNGDILLQGPTALVAGGTLTNAGALRGDGRVAGAIVNQASGAISVDGGKRLNLLGPTLDNAGHVTLVGSAGSPAILTVDGAATNAAGSGLISAANGKLWFNGGLTNSGTLAVTTGDAHVYGAIDNTTTGQVVVTGGATVTFYGNIHQDGTLQVSKSGSTKSVAVFLGTVTGAGGASGAGDIFYEGVFNPGNSPARVTYSNDVFFGAASQLGIELGGTVAGSGYDQLAVSGALMLGGTLNVSLWDEFLPAAGQTFTLATATGGITGDFTAVVLPHIAGLTWSLDRTTTSLVLRLGSATGDFNGDGRVNGNDFLAWQRGLGRANPTVADGDANGDGHVDAADLAYWKGAFGNGGGATAAAQGVPEPTALGLAAAALATAGIRRRRRSPGAAAYRSRRRQ
jgi:arylsulfatase A-like enzyme